MEEKEHELSNQLQLSSLVPRPAPLLSCVSSDFALPRFSHP